MPTIQRTRRGALPTVKRPGGRSARIRQAVFDATLELLARKGDQAFSIEAVAEAAGVNKTTIYRNWPTKAKLIQAAAADRSAKAIVVRRTGDMESDFRRLLKSVAEYVASPIGRSLIIATVSEGDDPQVRDAQAEFWQTRFAAARLVLGVAEGDDPAAQAAADEAIEHLIGPLFLRAFITGAPIDSRFIEATAKAAAKLARGAVDGEFVTV